MKNSPTLEQISLACRHVDELIAVGVTENLAIRTLELFTDVYANLLVYKKAGPHHVDKVPISRWSLQARETRAMHPTAKPKDHFRVEHGTPRRGLARKVLELARDGGLNPSSLDATITRFYRLAVITIEEDSLLNSLSRSGILESPESRWELAGIKF